MNSLNVEAIYANTINKKPIEYSFGACDHSRFFMPENLTQLFYMPHYQKFSPEQRLRYNQLFSIRTAEQLMTLEESFIAVVLAKANGFLQKEKNSQLIHCMKEMAAEEEIHFAMFYDLNKAAEPGFYAKNTMVFAQLGYIDRAMLAVLTSVPGLTIFLLWALLILEEFSTYISKQILKHDKQFPDALEKNFVTAHREHLKDETRHVQICANLIIQLTDNASGANISLNQYLLKKFMCEYMAPKRGGIRVVKKLVEEMPELLPLENVIVSDIRSQAQDRVIWDALRSPAAMPVSNGLFARFPGFCVY